MATKEISENEDELIYAPFVIEFDNEWIVDVIPIGYQPRDSLIFRSIPISDRRPYEGLIPRYPKDNAEECTELITMVNNFKKQPTTDKGIAFEDNWIVCLYYLAKDKDDVNIKGMDPKKFVEDALKKLFPENKADITHKKIKGLFDEPISRFLSSQVNEPNTTLPGSCTLYEIQQLAMLIIAAENVIQLYEVSPTTKENFKKIQRLFESCFKNIFGLSGEITHEDIFEVSDSSRKKNNREDQKNHISNTNRQDGENK